MDYRNTEAEQAKYVLDQAPRQHDHVVKDSAQTCMLMLYPGTWPVGTPVSWPRPLDM